MTEPTTTISTFAFFTKIATVVSPFLLAIIAFVVWRLKLSTERGHELEDKLREDRIEVYDALLEPYVIFFTPEELWEADPVNNGEDKMVAMQRVLHATKYRKAVLKMSLVAPDNVVMSFNALMRHFYTVGTPADEQETMLNLNLMMELLGTFMLEIRKSMGNEKTKISSLNMLSTMFKDAATLETAQQ